MVRQMFPLLQRYWIKKKTKKKLRTYPKTTYFGNSNYRYLEEIPAVPCTSNYWGLTVLLIVAPSSNKITMSRNNRTYHTFTTKYVHFAYVILTWLSSTYHSCGAQKFRCDNGSRGWYGFFAQAKNPYHHIPSTMWSCLWLPIWYQANFLERKMYDK